MCQITQYLEELSALWTMISNSTQENIMCSVTQ